MSGTLQVADLVNGKLDVETIAGVAMVGTTADTITNRAGDVIDTLEGRLKRVGFEPPLAYAAGIEFLTPADAVKSFDNGGIVYGCLASSRPFTTTGNFAADSVNFFVVQDPTNSAGNVRTDTSNTYAPGTTQTFDKAIASRYSFDDGGNAEYYFYADSDAFYLNRRDNGDPATDKSILRQTKSDRQTQLWGSGAPQPSIRTFYDPGSTDLETKGGIILNGDIALRNVEGTEGSQVRLKEKLNTLSDTASTADTRSIENKTNIANLTDVSAGSFTVDNYPVNVTDSGAPPTSKTGTLYAYWTKIGGIKTYNAYYLFTGAAGRRIGATLLLNQDAWEGFSNTKYSCQITPVSNINTSGDETAGEIEVEERTTTSLKFTCDNTSNNDSLRGFSITITGT